MLVRVAARRVKTMCLKAAHVFYHIFSMTTNTQTIKAISPQLYFARVKTGPSSANKGRC